MSEYISELELSDPKASKDLLEIFREIIRDEIKKAPFNRMLPAKVISVGSGVASIQLMSDGVTISNIPNKTGGTLVIGDYVWVEFINNSGSNFYIALKNS